MLTMLLALLLCIKLAGAVNPLWSLGWSRIMLTRTAAIRIYALPFSMLAGPTMLILSDIYCLLVLIQILRMLKEILLSLILALKVSLILLMFVSSLFPSSLLPSSLLSPFLLSPSSFFFSFPLPFFLLLLSSSLSSPLSFDYLPIRAFDPPPLFPSSLLNILLIFCSILFLHYYLLR